MSSFNTSIKVLGLNKGDLTYTVFISSKGYNSDDSSQKQNIAYARPIPKYVKLF